MQIYIAMHLRVKKATNERYQRRLDDVESLASTSQQNIIKNKCRICLKTATLPIYNDHQGSDISEDICTFGDIQISEDDEHPKFICNFCLNLLDAAKLFRQTAKTSDQILKNALAERLVYCSKAPDLENDSSVTASNSAESMSVLKNFLAVESDNELFSDDSKPVRCRKKISKVQCRICFKIITKAYYKEHFALHDQTVAQYVCDVCGKSFRYRSSYRNHYFTHRSDFPFKCELCPYKGRYSGVLKTHMRTHTGDFRYMCTECPARFLTKSNLNKHALIHKEPMYKCDICQKGYHSKIVLGSHFEVEHLGVKNHVCNVCGKSFGYRKTMMRHQLHVHKRQKKMNGRTPAYLEAEMKKLEGG